MGKEICEGISNHLRVDSRVRRCLLPHWGIVF